MPSSDSDHPPDTAAALDDATLALRVGRTASVIDHEAEAELCRRLAPRVRLYGLRHLRNLAGAEDLMQQVMVLMIERLRSGALREPDRLASFVFGICRMVVLDLRRGEARREQLLNTYGDILQPSAPSAPELDNRRLAYCLERLPDRDRIVLLMTFYDDMPAEKLARELELSRENVRVIRHRGLKRLRNCMDGESS